VETKAVPTKAAPVDNTATNLTQKDSYFYDPAGKTDPFRPIFAIETEPLPSGPPEPKPSVPLTLLQRIGLSQLKLKGIICSPAGNKALVRDPSGKGYIVTNGTYVGKNLGRVKRILKDKVIVEEQVKDFLTGGTKLQIKELRFIANG